MRSCEAHTAQWHSRRRRIVYAERRAGHSLAFPAVRSGRCFIAAYKPL